MEAHKEMESKGLQPFYERIVEQLSSLDQKAQAMVSLEGLLLALIAVFSSSIPNNQPARAATWGAMILLLSSALCSLMVMRIRYGTTILSGSRNVEEGLVRMREWRDNKLRFHNVALRLLAAGLLGLVVVLTLILL
jgi:hypothetical protein